MTILIILMRFSPYHQPFIELTKILNIEKMMNWYAIFAVNEKESILVSILKFKNSKNESFPTDSSDVCDTFYMEWNEKFMHYWGVINGLEFHASLK